MRIGLLNPWEHAAENQLIPVLTAVANQLGHTAFECKNTQDIFQKQPDLIISMSRTQPKLTNVPTYGLLFDPRDILLRKASYLDNIYSWDGVFTIFDKLQDFTSDLMYAARRDVRVGYFYPTCRTIVWDTPIDFGSATLAYFGTNWDRRRENVFTHLDGELWMEVYGPPHGWTFLKGSTYKGSLPFDGHSVIQRYHNSGAGLCLFSDSHFADDIVTSRIFEVSAAGAIIIAPRMPWLEHHYGETVLYLDQHLPDQEIAEQIRSHMDWIRSHPSEASELAAASHKIFTEQFSMERLLAGALDFHETSTPTTSLPAETPDLTVIVTCQNRSASALRRTFESLVRQGYPSLQILVSVGVDSGLDAFCRVLDEYAGRLPGISLRVADGPYASALIWGPLRACSGDLVAVVESGDEWMDGHIAYALAARSANAGAKLLVSGCIQHLREPYRSEGGNMEIRRLRPFPFFYQPPDPVREALDLPISSVIFQRDILDAWSLQDPQLNTGSSAHLVMSLLEKASPTSTYHASTVHYDPEVAISVWPTPDQLDDLARLRARFVGRTFSAFPRLTNIDALRDAVQRVENQQRLEQERRSKHGDVVEYLLPPQFAYAVGAEANWDICDTPVTLAALQFQGTSRPEDSCADGIVLPLIIEPEPRPWAIGLVWTPTLVDERPHVIRIICRIERGTAAFGVRAVASEHMDHRVLVGSHSGHVVVNLPVRHPSTFGGIVIQAAHSEEPVRVILEHAEVFAASIRLPVSEIERFMERQQMLREEVDSLSAERDALIRELSASRNRIREIRASRVWRLGQFYWRLHGYLTRPIQGRRR
ncbi:MAG: glycosyltransferase [Chloroflexi bacterium]|nr:glycosyltransferase [Chloroflexota bacterium]